jgi:hypothetical protein
MFLSKSGYSELFEKITFFRVDPLDEGTCGGQSRAP